MHQQQESMVISLLCKFRNLYNFDTVNTRHYIAVDKAMLKADLKNIIYSFVWYLF